MHPLRQFLAYAPIAGVALQVLLATVLLSKGIWRRYPVFVGYSVASFVATLGFFMLRMLSATPATLFYYYWSCEGLTVVLAFAVVYEMFKVLFESHTALRNLAVVSFRFVFVALLVVASIAVYVRSSTGTINPLVEGVTVLEQATRIVEVGLLMFLFIFSTAFGLHWRQQVFGIAVGLGLFTCADLVGVSAFTHYGTAAVAVFSVARVLSFDLSLLIWIGYMLAPERVAVASELPKTAQLERWNQAILELIHQ